MVPLVLSLQLTIPSSSVCGTDFMWCLGQANPMVHEVEQSFLLEQLEVDSPDLVDPQTAN